MKKILLTAILLSGIVMNAQQVIVDEKYEKDNIPLEYDYLLKQDKIIIEKGKLVGGSTNKKTNNIYAYDKTGKKEVLLQNDEVMNSFYSVTENSFRVTNYQSMSYNGKEYKIHTNGKTSPILNEDDMAIMFNDNFEIKVINQKNEMNEINLAKDDLFLYKKEILTGKEEKIKLEKPNVDRILGDGLIKQIIDSKAVAFKHYLINYRIGMIDNNSFEIITKSITNDFKKATTYRTIYNLEGKIIKDIAFEVTIPNFYLNYSHGYSPFFNGKEQYCGNDIRINNFMVDPTTGDIYFYGLFSKEGGNQFDLRIDCAGYYIFKFDSSGKKIWESINTVADKEITDEGYTSDRTSDIYLKQGKLIFTINANRSEKYTYVGFIDSNTGVNISNKKINFEKDKMYTVMTGSRDFIFSFYTNKDLKKKTFDSGGLMLLEYNKNFADYVKGNISKDKLFFNTVIAKNGTWVIESDNESYYKVLYFND